MKPKLIISENGRQLPEVDGLPQVNLGGAPVGGRIEKELTAMNVSGTDLTAIRFEFDFPDIKIISAPDTLKAGEEGKIVIEYAPNLQTEHGAQVKIKIRGKYYD